MDQGNEAEIDNQPKGTAFQQRVQPWLLACFGAEISADKVERNHRFLEEALELVQACGCTQSEAHQLVDYVFGRPVGEPVQEVGGVMVTLAALCLANGLDMHAGGETKLARIWTKVEAIRAKQAAKPKHSPLPVAQTPAPAPDVDQLAQFIRRIHGRRDMGAGELAERIVDWLGDQPPAVKAEPIPDLTPEQLADKCEGWLQTVGASNIVDAYEAGYRDCEAAHAAIGAPPPTRKPDYPGEVVDSEDTARLGKLFEGKTVEGVLATLSKPSVQKKGGA